MADDFALMHDVENACAEFAQSLETYAEFLRRHPGTEVDLPKGQVADVPLTGAGCKTRPHDQFSQHSSNRKLSANGTEAPVLGNDRIPETPA